MTVISCKLLVHCNRCVVTAKPINRVRPGGLDSLLRLLLGVELIQPRVVELLVDKLMGCSTEPTLRKFVCVCVCGVCVLII